MVRADRNNEMLPSSVCDNNFAFLHFESEFFRGKSNHISMWNYTEQHKNMEKKMQSCKLNDGKLFASCASYREKSWKFDTKMCVTFANSLETVDLKLCANPSEASSWNCHPHFLLHPPTELRTKKVFGFAFGFVFVFAVVFGKTNWEW